MDDPVMFESTTQQMIEDRLSNFEWDTVHPIQERMNNVESRLYALERLIYAQVLLGKRIEAIETMIDAEEYSDAKLEINGLLRYLGDVPELHGLMARIDVIEMLGRQS